MKFRLEAFWLFLLTFVSSAQLPLQMLQLLQLQGNHKQLSVDYCQRQGGVAIAAAAAAAAPLKSIETHKGNELENATKLRKTAKQTQAVIGDITTTTTSTTTIIDGTTQPGQYLATQFGHQTLKLAKSLELPQNFALDFKQSMAKFLASDEATSSSHTTELNQMTTSSHPHQTERRHVVPDKLQYTKEIHIKQGRLMGITRRFQVTSGLRDVDQYLGLPYAEAPTGSRRFMPPGAPLPWQGLKIARHLPPVCPQKLPDIRSHGNISRGRYNYLTRLLPYLKTESEDCLYLNLYVPHEELLSPSKLHPVLVYLHGESFEWNSGNGYDGSVLASYGEVIVVTLNYRLGVLGFLRPGLDAQNIANYALLDQIAALHWVKENIGSFGGDNSRVTLMGHSTGAACVNYLMVSPVADGLFHRAVLMSGSAMSDWAASNQTLQLTMQIAQALGCPLGEEDELLECLRQRRYQDIVNIPTALPQFSTSLGPIVDGHVIPNQPYKVMGHYTEHFSRYDLLFGITESESYHTLAALALEEGLRENERDNLLRFYMQSRFDVRPDLALAATLKKYQDMYNNPIKATNLEHRDVALDILSDARVVGPLLQTGLFHADVNRRNYMYVFAHNSATGPYANLPHSIAGEELAYIFGAPLAPAGSFPSHNYSVQEKLLSEAVMAYWTNFVKTGNPKAPWKGTFINSHALAWDRYDLDWPEFNRRGQAYLNIGIPPTVGYKYRQIYMNFWNKELPDELNQIAAIQEQQQQLPPSKRGGGELITGHLSKYGQRGDNGVEDPVRTLKMLLQEPTPLGHAPTEAAAENMYNAPPTFGHISRQQGDLLSGSASPVDGQSGQQEQNAADAAEPPVAKSETTLQLLIALIAVFIVLNLIIYATFLLQKRRKRATSLQRKLGGMLSYEGANDEELKRSKSHDGDDSYVLDMVRKSNTYEAIKTGQRSPINGYAISRQLSSSTVDTHTKVSEWMEGQGQGLGHTLPKCASPAFSSLSGSFATPPSQVEAELSKSKDGRLIICQDMEVSDANLLTPQHLHEGVFQYDELLLQRQHSALTEPSEERLLPQHQHSRSDPVDLIICQQLADEQMSTSFVHADDIDVDINVTSRDLEATPALPLTAAQQMELLRLRNYPKVLPTDQPMTLDLRRSCKRNSLPPHSFAPPPPPRFVGSSTLGRRRDSSNITTSPLMLAKDCIEDEPREPEITQNTLIVGPIVPKSPRAAKSELLSQPAASTQLSGSFQSFESVPPPPPSHETTPPAAAQRTERVYAIEATPATPTTSWHAPNGALYAQPLKSASRSSLIPRKLQQPQPGRDGNLSAAGAAATAATAINGAATSGAATVATTTAATATSLPQTRIPQLHRQFQAATEPQSTTIPTTTATTAIPTTTAATISSTAVEDLAADSFKAKTNAAAGKRSISSISSGSTSSWCSSSSSSSCSSSSTGTVRTELQQNQHQSITTNI